MANIVSITKLLDGARSAVFHVFIESDGVSGDMADEVLIDPADLVPSLGSVPSLTVEELWYDLTGFTAKLEFDYLASDTPVWSMSANAHMDFSRIGGLKDRSNVLDGSGKLKLSTSGLTADGDRGSIVIKLRKD